MKLRVDHRTTYRFDPPAAGLAQSLRLHPTDSASQSVVRWNVTVDGATMGSGFRDGAGDWVETAILRGVTEDVTVAVEGIIDTADTSGVLKGVREKIPPLAYLEPGWATRPSRAITDLAAAALDNIDPKDVLAQAHALTGAVADAVTYVPGTTDSETAAADAFAAGSGVCQDQAHVLIAAALTQDIPARYVTGYFFATEGTVGGEASHAWAEIHVPDLGWVGFDPTNRKCPDEHYIRLGSGREAQEAAPIRGISQGGSSETLDVAVAVTQASQEQ